MTIKHYTLITAVVIIAGLGVFIAVSNRNNDIVIENSNVDSSPLVPVSVTNNTTTSTTTITGDKHATTSPPVRASSTTEIQ